MKKRLVVIETPFAGDVKKNVQYARACLRDCLINHNEFPFISHLLYTQTGVLDDNNLEERKLGIEAGLTWVESAEATIVYTDLGISKGMEEGIEKAKKKGRQIEFRKLGNDWEKRSKEILSKNQNHPFLLNKVDM